MHGKPYKDASGVNVDSLVLVYRVTLPTYVAPGHANVADGHHDDDHHGDHHDYRDDDHRDNDRH